MASIRLTKHEEQIKKKAKKQKSRQETDFGVRQAWVHLQAPPFITLGRYFASLSLNIHICKMGMTTGQRA